jgi:hypothetical protein
VNEASIAAGITLVEWFIHETERVYFHWSCSEEDRDALKLVAWIRRRGGETTGRALQKASPTRYPATANAEAALEELAKCGLGLWIDVPPGPKGGRPTRKFLLNPAQTQPKPDETSDGENGEVSGGAGKTSDETSAPSENLGEKEVSSVLVVSAQRKSEKKSAPSATPPLNGEEGFAGAPKTPDETSSDTPSSSPESKPAQPKLDETSEGDSEEIF